MQCRVCQLSLPRSIVNAEESWSVGCGEEPPKSPREKGDEAALRVPKGDVRTDDRSSILCRKYQQDRKATACAAAQEQEEPCSSSNGLGNSGRLEQGTVSRRAYACVLL